MLLFGGLLFEAQASTVRRPHSYLDDPAAEAALSYERARETAAALRLWESMLDRYRSKPELWLRIARLRLKLLGREATLPLMHQFLALPEAQRSLVPDVEAGFRQLSELFLTDEGQTLYFDGQKRSRAGECSDAVLAFHRALKLEGPHRGILLEKARCERRLDAIAPYYETLREVDRTSFLDVALAEDLAEAHLYHQAPRLALDVVGRVARVQRTPRLELVAALAELDLGEAGRAADWLRASLDRVRGGRLSPQAVDPLVYYGLGIAEHRNRPAGTEAITYLRRFVAEPSRPRDRWDPYRRAERFEEAKRILAEFDAPPSAK